MWIAVKVYSAYADLAVVELNDDMLKEVSRWRGVVAGALDLGIETASFHSCRAEFLRNNLGCGDEAFRELMDLLMVKVSTRLFERPKFGRHVRTSLGLAVCGSSGVLWSCMVGGVLVETEEVPYGMLEAGDERSS